MDSRLATLEPSQNGQKRSAKPRSAHKTANAPRKSVRPSTTLLRQRIAYTIGIVGACGLVLSIWHVTEAIHLLTPSAPVALAVLLAVAIDAGIVACELGAIIGDGDAQRHCDLVVRCGIAVSAALNALAMAHAVEGQFFAVAAAILGGYIPLQVYWLFRAAGRLWRDKPVQQPK